MSRKRTASLEVRDEEHEELLTEAPQGPEPGALFLDRDGGVWRVAAKARADGIVGLSGPGPARSYRSVTLKDLERGYTPTQRLSS